MAKVQIKSEKLIPFGGIFLSIDILLKNSAFQTLYIKSLGKFLNVLEFGDILPRSISIGSHLLVF